MNAATPRRWNRRRAAGWLALGLTLTAGGFVARERWRERRQLAVIDRIDRLGGSVELVREYAPWQAGVLRYVPFLEPFLGHDTTRVKFTTGSPSADDLRKLARLPELTMLSLRARGLDDRALAAVGDLTELRELWLTGSDVTDAGLLPLARLRHLQSLDLINTAVTDAGVRALTGLPDLQVLYLDGTRVTDDVVTELVRLPQIEAVTVRRTAATNVTASEVVLGGSLAVGGTTTITGRLHVGVLPPSAMKVTLYAYVGSPTRDFGQRFAVGTAAVQTGSQAFTLTGTLPPCSTGDVVSVNVVAVGTVGLAYRVARVPIHLDR